MNGYLKSYAMFVAFLLVTKIVVAPAAKSFGLPYLGDL